MKLGDLEINFPEPEREDWIDWPINKPVPDCGAFLDAGELGRIRVTAVQTKQNWSDFHRARIRIEIVEEFEKA